MYEYKVEAIGDPTRDQDEVQGLLNEYAIGGWRFITVTPAKYGICGIFEREEVVESRLEETAVARADAKVVALWLDKLGPDDLLANTLLRGRESGEWDGGFEQLVEIADGSRKVAGIGPKRQRQLAELVKTA